MQDTRLRIGAAVCGLWGCVAPAAHAETASAGDAIAIPGAGTAYSTGALVPEIRRWFSGLQLKLADGRAARAFARTVEPDDETDQIVPMLSGAPAAAVAASEAAPVAAGERVPASGGTAAPTSAPADERAVYGAGLGLGFHLDPDTSISASYRLVKPYTGQSDIDYLKFKPEAAKEDISLDFRDRKSVV
jgi:hypothetical protein